MIDQTSTKQLPLLAAVFLLLLPLMLLACASEGASSPTATPPPMPTATPASEATPAQIGVRYVHQLYTHCGVRYADFDGRRWLADTILTNDEGVSPPPGWGNPIDPGTIELVTKDRALFLSQSGERAFFNPAPEDYQFKPCL